MKLIGNLLELFISLVIIVVIIGLAGIVSAHIIEFLEDKIDDLIYKIREKEYEENRSNANHKK